MTDAAPRPPGGPGAPDVSGRLAGGAPPWEPATIPQAAIRPGTAGPPRQPAPQFAPRPAPQFAAQPARPAPQFAPRPVTPPAPEPLPPPAPEPLPPPAPQAAARPAPPARQPGRRGGWLTSLPYLAVLAGVGTGLWWASLSAHRVRGGTLAVAGTLFVAALARLVLPEKWAGMLASRKRLTDVVTLVALACGLLAAGLVLPTSS